MYKVKNKPRTSLFRLIVIWLAFKSHTQYIWNSCNASISWAFQHFNQSIFQNKEAGMSNSNHPLNSSNPLHYTKFKASLMDNLPHRETRAHADAQPQEAGRHFGRWQTPMGGGKQADSWTCTESPKSAETQSPLWWQPPCYARHKCIAVFPWNNAKKLAQHTLQGNASPPSFQVYIKYIRYLVRNFYRDTFEGEETHSFLRPNSDSQRNKVVERSRRRGFDEPDWHWLKRCALVPQCSWSHYVPGDLLGSFSKGRVSKMVWFESSFISYLYASQSFRLQTADVILSPFFFFILFYLKRNSQV